MKKKEISKQALSEAMQYVRSQIKHPYSHYHNTENARAAAKLRWEKWRKEREAQKENDNPQAD